jgi:hypothetical protein
LTLLSVRSGSQSQLSGNLDANGTLTKILGTVYQGKDAIWRIFVQTDEERLEADIFCLAEDIESRLVAPEILWTFRIADDFFHFRDFLIIIFRVLVRGNREPPSVTNSLYAFKVFHGNRLASS